MNGKYKIIIFLILAGALLSGCSPKLTEGEIIEKKYVEEWTEYTTVPMVHTNGKNTYTTVIPMTYHHPEQWRIYIKSLTPNEEGNYDTAVYYTTEELYDACNIGDIFSYDAQRDSDTEMVEKSKR